MEFQSNVACICLIVFILSIVAFILFILAYSVIGGESECKYEEKQNRLDDRKRNMANMYGLEKLVEEKIAIKKEAKNIEMMREKIDNADTVAAFITIILLAVFVLSLFLTIIFYALRETTLSTLNYKFEDMEIVSYEDRENNIILSAVYNADIKNRKVFFNLKVTIINMNFDTIAYARVIDNNTGEKFDISSLKPRAKYSHILLYDVNESTKYDLEIKNIILEE